MSPMPDNLGAARRADQARPLTDTANRSTTIVLPGTIAILQAITLSCHLAVFISLAVQKGRGGLFAMAGDDIDIFAF